VMEGKGVLFKKFAGIDVFDLEVEAAEVDRFVDIVAALEPTFGGINLEDIKSPECFLIEGKLRKRLNIPVFHDDQHGTAIIVAAAVINGLRLVKKSIGDVRLVMTGAGASGIACVKLLVSLGLEKDNVIAVDRTGVIYKNRPGGLTPHKRMFASKTDARTLADAMQGADIFLGLSGPGVVQQEMIRSMAKDPLVFTLSNPIPEILPEEVKAVRDDAIIATGRSDYPNQVNNVLCFPFIFRGALDVGATTINEEMKIACVHALAELAHEEAPDTVVTAYGKKHLSFGPDYLIPKPFDPRLMVKLAPAVARAAMDSGVATRPIEDFDAYIDQLERYVFQSAMVMRPLFEQARETPKRLVYTEATNHKVLRAIQNVVDEQLARPILVGKAKAIEKEIRDLGLRFRFDIDVDLIETEEEQHEAQTLRACHLVNAGDADAILCGIRSDYRSHLKILCNEIGLHPGLKQPSSMSLLLLKRGLIFSSDSAVKINPDMNDIVETTMLAAEGVRNFGIEPRIALVSHDRYGEVDSRSTRKMYEALQTIRSRKPDFEVYGDMRADEALHEAIRRSRSPNSPMKGEANLLIMPDLDSASIAYDMIKVIEDAVSISPILLGFNHPVHILTPSSTVRRIVNICTLMAVKAQMEGDQLDLSFAEN
ncbi:MAG: NADP-dependent malic enzyme, partial [Thiotrichales bacterium]|nr:NADP-dependent malic enzyme [Thiotrichales bacterium]